MSVAEMKVKAFEGLATLKDEEALKEVILLLDKLNTKKFDADAFFKKASEQYGDVLKKLAE